MTGLSVLVSLNLLNKITQRLEILIAYIWETRRAFFDANGFVKIELRAEKSNRTQDLQY